MGDDRIRHLLIKRARSGAETYYWNPSATLRAFGLAPEALGRDWTAAKRRAIELNALADACRLGAKRGQNGPLPGSVGQLFAAFQADDDFAGLKPRTRKDYAYYLAKIEAEFGPLPVASLSARVIKVYYKRLKRETGVTWAYHILGTLRAALSWAVSEDWIARNPALDVRVASPAKRRVVWQPEQAAAYVAHAHAAGWPSLAAMALVMDCIAQSPVDVRGLRARDYDGRTIGVTRAKTGATDAPIPLFPDVKAELDLYLATRPALHPEAPLFVNDRTKRPWAESTLHKVHAEVRDACGLPKALQLQDFRRTAQTEGGAVSGTVDELRSLARHKTRKAAEHYVMPDARYVESIQQKRLAARNERGEKRGP